MTVSEQQLNEILAGIIEKYGKKGSISTHTLFDMLEKLDLTAAQMDQVYSTLGEAGIQIVDEDQRDRELFEQDSRPISPNLVRLPREESFLISLP